MKTLSVIIIFTLSLYSNVTWAQTGSGQYSILGNIEGLKDGWVFKVMQDQSSPDSVQAVAGKFTFKGVVNEPSKATIFLSGLNKGIEVFLEKNTELKIQGDAGKNGRLSVTGGKCQAEYNKYRKSIEPIETQLEMLNNKQEHQDIGLKERELIEKQYDSLYMNMQNLAKLFIRHNPTSFVSLSLLNGMLYHMQPKLMQEMFNNLDDRIKQSKGGKKIEETIAIKLRTDIGQVALDFVQPDTLGKAISLSSFKGKYVLLDFWASWCGPCRAENPYVLKAYQKFKDQNFTVISVSIDTDRKAWLKAVQQDGLPWTQVSDLKPQNSAATIYAIKGIPSNFLIDPSGKIIERNLRGEYLINKLGDMMNKP